MPTPSKPRNIHVLQGTFRQDRHGHPESNLQAMDPTPPDHLDVAVVAAWDELAAQCRPYLAQSDRASLEIASKLLAGSRAGSNSAAADTLLARMLEKLGASPAGRARLHPINAGQPEPNPFDEFEDLGGFRFKSELKEP